MARICVVEADDFLQRVLGVKLTQEGHSVIKLSAGEKALDTFRRQKPDLILLALILPGITGFEVLEQLRKEKGKLGKTPVIVISKLTAQADVERAMALGANEYIKKSEKDIGDTLVIINSYLQKVSNKK